VKDNLKENAALIHIDFSENYVGKYTKESQSMHFGASKQQVSLHTGVLYIASSKPPYVGEVDHSQPASISFCTASSSTRHDPSSIWAHLKLILMLVKDVFPNIDRIHFMSDGPRTQYRNKKHFYLMTTYLQSIIPINQCTWNFSEAGHGKGATDRVGGLVKRTGDRLVAEGGDIPDAVCLLEKLQ